MQLSLLLLAIFQIRVAEDTEEAAPAAEGEAGEPTEGGEEPEEEEEEPATCNQELLNGYGLLGIKDKEDMQMDICTGVSTSCCALEDQLAIYDTLTKGEELKNLDQRFEYHKKVYTDVIEQLSRVPELATKILETTKGDPLYQNCSLVASRILQFELETITPIVKEGLEKMHAFFKESFKGVYCSICDAKSQFLIDGETKTVTLSEKFCREVTSNSLHMLLYFHVHFKKFMSLSNALVTLCDGEGNFIPEEAVPGAVQLGIKNETKNLLSDCRKYRNDPSWLEHCAGICEEFHLTRFAEFFQPDIVRYHKAALYLKTKLDEFNGDGPQANEERMLLSLKARKIRKSRLLDQGEDAAEAELEAEAEEEEALAEGEERPLTIPELEQKFDDLTVLVKREDADVRLDKLKVVYEQPGVELYDQGVGTILTEDAYQKVLDAIKMRDKLAKQAEAPADVSANILSAFVVAASLLLLFS